MDENKGQLGAEQESKSVSEEELSQTADCEKGVGDVNAGQDCTDKEPEEKTDGGERMEIPFVTFLPKGSSSWVKKPIQVRAVRMEATFKVKTLEGELIGNAGDYLIEGIEGELYPCKPQIFCATYDKA